jgi:hypothetical protein
MVLQRRLFYLKRSIQESSQLTFGFTDEISLFQNSLALKPYSTQIWSDSLTPTKTSDPISTLTLELLKTKTKETPATIAQQQLLNNFAQVNGLAIPYPTKTNAPIVFRRIRGGFTLSVNDFGKKHLFFYCFFLNKTRLNSPIRSTAEVKPPAGPAQFHFTHCVEFNLTKKVFSYQAGEYYQWHSQPIKSLTPKGEAEVLLQNWDVSPGDTLMYILLEKTENDDGESILNYVGQQSLTSYTIPRL